MKKTGLCVVLSLAVLFILAWAGCKQEQIGAPVELKVATITIGGDFSDFSRIQGKVNEIVKKKINATVNYQLISETNYAEQILLMVSSGEQLDLMISADWLRYFDQIRTGQLMDMEPYLKYCPGAVEAVGMDRIDSVRFDNKIYGIPTTRDLAQNSGYAVLKDIAVKYGLDKANIKNLEDLTPYFEKIVQGERLPCWSYDTPGSPSLGIYYDALCDDLGDRNGVLMGMKGRKVENLYATQEYKKTAEIVYEWNRMGAIPKDLSTLTFRPESMVKSGALLGYEAKLKPGYAEKTFINIGKEMLIIELSEPRARTGNIVVMNYSLPIICKHPEKAAEYLNLLYSDPDVVNLVTYGEEGIDYVLDSEGIAQFPPGVTPDNAKYNPGWGWLVGNQYLSHPFAPDTKDIWSRLKAFNDEAVESDAFGFMWNPGPVSAEIVAVENVKRQYINAIGNGEVDPNDIIPKFLRDLENAGMNKIIDEKQKQLDAWFAAKKI
ncbi:MAG: ABC transporter substrate-binding protein [Treponema sp.]|jgi:putative aldouronate transport system substrate-binding protein|nr:ABC transporter substrate-binding protein [Treponema sp.]